MGTKKAKKWIYMAAFLLTLTGCVSVSGDLGKSSGESARRREKLDEAEDWNNNLYFELVTRNTAGDVREYQVQMVVDEVTE